MASWSYSRLPHLQSKADGQLEIQLHRGALELPSEGVKNCDVNLGSIKGAVCWIGGGEQAQSDTENECFHRTPSIYRFWREPLRGSMFGATHRIDGGAVARR